MHVVIHAAISSCGASGTQVQGKSYQSYESVVVIISYLRSSFIRTFRGRPEVRRECTIPVLAGRLNSR